MASALALAFVVYSCKGNLSEADKLDLDTIPLETVDSMFFLESENGRLKMRVEAPRMEVYEHDSVAFDLFPRGLNVFGYAEDGALETTIVSDQARHDKNPGTEEEQWSAFGHVVIRNVAKKETMETDTLYWDSKARDRLLHQNVFAIGNHAGLRHAFRRNGAQRHPHEPVQQ